MSGIAIDRESAGTLEVQPRLSARKAAFAALAFLALFGAGRYGYSWWIVGRFLESTDDAYVGGNITPISPQVAGFVTGLLVKDNQPVHAGELLIRLDARTYQAVLDRAKAAVRQQEATLDNLHAKLTLQQSAIQQAEADLSGKVAQAVFAGEDAERYRSLASTDAGSRQNSQRGLAANLSAQAAVVAARAGLEAAKQQLLVLNTEIGQTNAAAEAAKADVEAAQLNLNYTEIRSPIEGFVGNRAAQLGAYVPAGSYLITVIPAHGLWIDANYKEDQLEQMRQGQPATIAADIYPGQVFNGHIASFAPATGATFSVIPAENATGNFTKIVQRLPVRIELDPNEVRPGMLRPGLSATVTVDTRSGREGAN